ncbi:hypothetical protein DBZ36_17760 [Alginatibacterium sediminis]|uniref:Uncharacterized protein n=1 Tax=Alginatibacterium sediminis TaxID=2164068 RepID=A0A420E7D3_9ALTE|nr:hypothetical protein [Alginatibacterium sediminis]RKF14497.1 hypothetical protein DBZ36_17760 [Alginatibacterium sediminis]
MKRTFLFTSLLISLNSWSTPITIDAVKFSDLGGQRYRVDVSLVHADSGWDHYANRWWLEDDNGNVLGERVLAHPHVNEQPFTRSQTIHIPSTLESVVVKASENRDSDEIARKLILLPQ